jgi:hypothetical protein
MPVVPEQCAHGVGTALSVFRTGSMMDVREFVTHDSVLNPAAGAAEYGPSSCVSPY